MLFFSRNFAQDILKKRGITTFPIFLFVLFGTFAPIVTVPARADDPFSLPSLNGNAGWIGARGPIAPPPLKGKIVLVDFWDYTCINCIRTFPHLNSIYKRYNAMGLIIIAIHSPEFSFAALPSRIQNAIVRYSISFPVVMDRDQILWHRFHNHYWPSDYLYDRSGHLVYHSFGEGGYEALEQNIRSLLALTPPPAPSASPSFPGDLTPELYTGTLRGRLGNPSGYLPGQSPRYKAPSHPKTGTLALEGFWKVFSDHITTRNRAEWPLPSIKVAYKGAGVNAVIKIGSRPVRATSFPVTVNLDGKPVPLALRGTDLRALPDGRTVIFVGRARMYSIISHQTYGIHMLALSFSKPGMELYTLTFNP